MCGIWRARALICVHACMQAGGWAGGDWLIGERSLTSRPAENSQRPRDPWDSTLGTSPGPWAPASLGPAGTPWASGPLSL